MSQALGSPLPCSCSTGAEAQSVLWHFAILSYCPLSLLFYYYHYFYNFLFFFFCYCKKTYFAELFGPVGLNLLSMVTRSSQSSFQKSLSLGMVSEGKQEKRKEVWPLNKPCAAIHQIFWGDSRMNTILWFKLLCLVPLMKTCRIWLWVQEQTAQPCSPYCHSNEFQTQLTTQNSSEKKDFRKRDPVAAAAELGTAVTCSLWAPWDFSGSPSILNFADTWVFVRHHWKVCLLNICIQWRGLDMPSHQYCSNWSFPGWKDFSVFAVGTHCFLLFLKMDSSK